MPLDAPVTISTFFSPEGNGMIYSSASVKSCQRRQAPNF
jgi:hypothetical protein